MTSKRFNWMDEFEALEPGVGQQNPMMGPSSTPPGQNPMMDPKFQSVQGAQGGYTGSQDTSQRPPVGGRDRSFVASSVASPWSLGQTGPSGGQGALPPSGGGSGGQQQAAASQYDGPARGNYNFATFGRPTNLAEHQLVLAELQQLEAQFGHVTWSKEAGVWATPSGPATAEQAAAAEQIQNMRNSVGEFSDEYSKYRVWSAQQSGRGGSGGANDQAAMQAEQNKWQGGENQLDREWQRALQDARSYSAGGRQDDQQVHEINMVARQYEEARRNEDWQGAQAALNRLHEIGLQKSTQDWQSAEGYWDRKWQSGEAEAGRDFTAGQAELDRGFASGEAAAGRDFEGGQADLQRAHQVNLQDDMQAFQITLDTQRQTFEGEQAGLDRELSYARVEMERDIEMGRINVAAQQNRILRELETKKIKLQEQQFKLSVFQSLAQSPEILWFLNESGSVSQFADLFQGDGGGALQSVLDSIGEFQVLNSQEYARLGSKGQGVADFGHTAQTGERNPGQSRSQESPLSANFSLPNVKSGR